MALTACPMIPVSWGELLDKIASLELERDRSGSQAGRAAAARALDRLIDIAGSMLDAPVVATLSRRLKAVNARLWEIEEDIRMKEKAGDFGDGFVRLARSLSLGKDERLAIRAEIDRLLESALVQEQVPAGVTFLIADKPPHSG